MSCLRSTPTSRSRGFTLLEVVIALAILSLSLGVLLEAQINGISEVDRSREMTRAAFLLRSKMSDLERQLFDEGFGLGEQEENGDFGDEGHPEIRWRAKISEVSLELNSFGDMCAQVEGAGDGETSEVLEGAEAMAGGSCEALVAGLSGALGGTLTDLAAALRAIEVEVTYPIGRYEQTMHLRALATRDDFGLSQAGAGGLLQGGPITGTPVNPTGAKP